MAVVEITVQIVDREGTPSTHYVQDLSLDGQRYRFETYTNKVDGCWYLDVGDSQGDPLVRSLALVTGLDLLWPYRYLDVPPGALWVQRLDGEVGDPTLDDFRERRAALYYQEGVAAP